MRCDATIEATSGATLSSFTRPPPRAVRADPALLPGLDRRFFRAIAGALRAQLEMGRVLQTVAPFEAVPAHDPHRLTAFRREASSPSAVRNPAEIHSQPCLVHRSSRRPGAVNPAPRATAADAGAAVKRPLLGIRTECAVNARLDSALAHFTQGRVEPHAGVIVKRLEALATQRTGFSEDFV